MAGSLDYLLLLLGPYPLSEVNDHVGHPKFKFNLNFWGFKLSLLLLLFDQQLHEKVWLSFVQSGPLDFLVGWGGNGQVFWLTKSRFSKTAIPGLIRKTSFVINRSYFFMCGLDFQKRIVEKVWLYSN